MFKNPLAYIAFGSHSTNITDMLLIAFMAYNLTTICEPIVYTMWDPQHLTTIGSHMVVRL
jgi:hypothetical protein